MYIEALTRHAVPNNQIKHAPRHASCPIPNSTPPCGFDLRQMLFLAVRGHGRGGRHDTAAALLLLIVVQQQSSSIKYNINALPGKVSFDERTYQPVTLALESFGRLGGGGGGS